MGCFEPFLDNNFGIINGLAARFAICHAAGQFGDFDDVSLIFVAPSYKHSVFWRFHAGDYSVIRPDVNIRAESPSFTIHH